MRPRATSSGFALVLALLVLALAGTVLAETARRTGRAVLAANEAQERLQLRWGSASVRRAALSAAERWLEAGRERSEAPRGRVSVSLALGDLEFDLTVADEQAKANVNLMAERRDPEGLADGLRALQRDMAEAMPVELRPSPPPAGLISKFPLRYRSFDQLFAPQRPERLFGAEPGSPRAGDRVTCWGNGQVNFRRAERAVLRETLRGLLNESQIDAICRAAVEKPECALEEALKPLDVAEEKLKAARSLLLDGSRCHSLHVAARGRTRSWHWLYVRQLGDAENDSQEYQFTW